MSGQFSRQTERRERLIERIALQRLALVRGVEPLRPYLTLADHGMTVLRYIRNHPGWVLGGVVLLTTLRLGQGGKWLRRGWLSWQVMHAWRAA